MKSNYTTIKQEWKAEREVKYQSVIIVALLALYIISGFNF